MSKSRTKISDEAFERVATGLVEALERGTEAWPLPEPPMSDPDFPAIPPTSPHKLFEEGLGILSVDRGMFDRHLNTVVDLIVPHRMNLSDDPLRFTRNGSVDEWTMWPIACCSTSPPTGWPKPLTRTLPTPTDGG